MVRGFLWACALVSTSLFLACDSSTGPQEPEPEDPRWSGPTRDVVITRRFDLVNASSSEPITVRFDTPDLVARMNVVAVQRTTTHPTRGMTTSANGMERVEFEVDLPPDGEVTLTLTWEVGLRHFDALAFQGPPPVLDPEDRAAYTAPSTHVQSDHPLIRDASEAVTSGVAGDLARVGAIVEFVRNHLDYELQSETRGALWALENGLGDCTEYAALGVALARSGGIPARVTGIENMVGAFGASTYDNHNAGEFWIEGYGWVPVDINYSQSPVGALPIRCVVMRWGLMAERDRESLSVGWYTWRTVSGPTGQLQVLGMGHEWEER